MKRRKPSRKRRPTPPPPSRCPAAKKRRKRLPKRKAPPRKRRRPVKEIEWTADAIFERQERQQENKRLAGAREKAEGARDRYRARKGDRGKLLLIGPDGKRVAPGKGRKGHLVYVSKTGKKQLVHAKGKEKYKARTFTDAAPPLRKNLSRAIAEFEQARLVRRGSGEAVPVTKGAANIMAPGGNDFSQSVSDKIAKSLAGMFRGQASQRSFLIEGMALFSIGGRDETIPFSLPIDRPDHIAIKLGGLKNFVRMKFYAHMARELAFHGFVTSGSANNIRRLPDNQGLPREEWTDSRGDPWQGADLETVTLDRVEWKIFQSTQ